MANIAPREDFFDPDCGDLPIHSSLKRLKLLGKIGLYRSRESPELF